MQVRRGYVLEDALAKVLPLGGRVRGPLLVTYVDAHGGQEAGVHCFRLITCRCLSFRCAEAALRAPLLHFTCGSVSGCLSVALSPCWQLHLTAQVSLHGFQRQQNPHAAFLCRH
jgi:hypothetical protein